MDVSIVNEISIRIETATMRYGELASTHEGLGVALEEWDELRAAIHENDLAQVAHECLDLAAILIRMAHALRRKQPTILYRSTK